uniref:NADH-ubiquinone oxidoreductase chain 5 n=1 Tax=Ectemnonotum fruhstorferi TaxID=2494696 RepID=A0A3Q8TK05_9HEMI|nr:NADH dehydrogenase subunit 5 [Ectemnonotum fruhstorferi]
MFNKYSLSFLMSMLMFFFSFIFFYLSIYVIINDSMFLFEWLIMTLNSSSICMSIIFDWMSLIFMSFVLLISSLVIYYSSKYMMGDFNKNRFFYLVMMFVLSMMFLIVSPNLISILLGWDGLGLISYCLVIYYHNYGSYNAGMLTSLMNRVGDLALLMSIAWMMNFGGWHYIFYLGKMYDFHFLVYMIILASFTKSAQLPFSSWLPAAMAAPTPVSALVHSSTLVTAGVYLLIRFNYLIYNFYLIDFFIIISLLTMFLSGISANFEYDLKKIIALSTLSQLGFMMCTLMLGFPTMAFFHLLTHALFKALLFLCAGVLIHCMWGNQDIRYMGGLIIQLPIVTSCMNISMLALCGFPFLSGFYSKDLIMEYFMMGTLNFFYFVIFLLSIGLTMMYSFRMLYYSLIKNVNLFSYLSVYDEFNNMSISVFFMMLFSVFGGSFLSWLIFKTPNFVLLPIDLSIITLVFILLGLMMGYLFSINNMLNFFSLMNFFLGGMWFLPMFSIYFVNKSLYLSLVLYKLVDKGWGEYFGPSGLSLIIINMTKFFQVFYMNNFKFYIISLFIWLFYMFVNLY